MIGKTMGMGQQRVAEKVVEKKHTHDLDSGTTTVAPTCTATGEKEYCCIYANCPYKKTESLKATGHKNKETRNYKSRLAKKKDILEISIVKIAEYYFHLEK